MILYTMICTMFVCRKFTHERTKETHCLDTCVSVCVCMNVSESPNDIIGQRTTHNLTLDK